METIFKALRSLRRNHAGLLLKAPEAQALRAALFRFDRTNRGHQHLLGQLCTSAMLPYPPADKDDVFRTRWWSFRYSMQDLLGTLPGTPKAAIPWEGDFQALWTAKDDSGCLKHFALQHMQKLFWSDSLVPAALKLQGISFEETCGRVQLAIALQHKQHPSLQATLRMVFECGSLDSLGACSIALREFRRKATELLAKADALPEFSVARMEAATGDICRKRLERMLSECSAEEKEWFAKNWSRLSPRGALASTL